MGIKSDSDILAGLAEHRASTTTEADIDEVSGVGETMEDGAEDDETDEDETDEPEEDEEYADADADADAPEEEAEPEEDFEPEPEPEEEKPSNADKEIARIQEAEKEAKQRINEKIKELEAERAAIDERAAKADEIEAKQAKLEKLARTNPVSLGKSLGLKTHEEFLAMGSTLYRYGKGLAPDAKPEHKQLAETISKEGEREQSLEEMRAKLEAFETKEAEREKKQAEAAEQAAKQAEADEMLNTFAASVVEAATDDYPNAKRVLTSKDVDANQKIIDVAIRLATLTDAPPTADQILDYIEYAESKKKSTTTTKAKPGTASEKKKAPPVKKKTKDQKSTGTKKSHKTDAEILKELAQRKAERQSA